MEQRNIWSRLTHLQVGRYAEYFVKMEFTLYGFDVYTTEVDDHGVDFIARSASSPYYEVQVKSARLDRGSAYIFMTKEKLRLDAHALVAVVLLRDGDAPDLYLIPVQTWQEPNALFVSRDYIGKVSKPEWGIQLSRRNLPMLAPYAFSAIAPTLY